MIKLIIKLAAFWSKEPEYYLNSGKFKEDFTERNEYLPGIIQQGLHGPIDSM
ncbi:hypothetical protein [Desulfonatronospira thiodismutans]|uniref:hypothetical protein n=1 Tax=Desulfonatronospira thiodismutans TaxID=488939 RepID=UPI0002FD5FC8|nr:hypothetical protein [Desulfonatronospira thiodismutans]